MVSLSISVLFGVFILPVASSQNALEKLQTASKTDPKDIGKFHKDVFDKLTHVYESKQDKNSLEHDFKDIMYSYCEEDDCRSMIDETLSDSVMAGKGHMTKIFTDDNFVENIEYPIEMDPELTEALDDVFGFLDQLKDDNVDSIVDELIQIEMKVEDMEDIHFGSKMMALSAISVAIESTKHWHQVFFDETHPLNELVAPSQNYRNRQLQVGGREPGPIQQFVRKQLDRLKVFFGVIVSDVLGILIAPMTAFVSFGLVNIITEKYILSILAAIPLALVSPLISTVGSSFGALGVIIGTMSVVDLLEFIADFEVDFESPERPIIEQLQNFASGDLNITDLLNGFNITQLIFGGK